MSHLQYFNYPGVGVENQKNYKYSQAVKIGDKIECSGQGGWDRETGDIPKEINAQIDQAFENCEVALKGAGGKGWSEVYRVTSYHIPLNNEALDAMVRNFKKYMPDHEPLWTCVGVPRLGLDDMRIEIEVWAHLQE